MLIRSLCYDLWPDADDEGVAQVAKELNVPCQVSLEERMGCGTGGCLGCACDGAGGKRYKVCKDGPVFPAEEVFF